MGLISPGLTNTIYIVALGTDQRFQFILFVSHTVCVLENIHCGKLVLCFFIIKNMQDYLKGTAVNTHMVIMDLLNLTLISSISQQFYSRKLLQI